MKFVYRCSLVLAVVLLANACTGGGAFSIIARKGDTVALGLGGSPSHEVSGEVEKENMQVTIMDSAGQTHTASLRYLFRLFADPTSKMYYNQTFDNDLVTVTSQAISRLYRYPFQGEWIAIVDLIDPITGTPLPLALGDATISVTTPDLDGSSQAYTTGSLDSIGITIVAGTGAPHPLVGGSPDSLQPLPQLEIGFDNSLLAPYGSGDNIIIGGVEFTLDYDETFFDIVRTRSKTAYPPMVRGGIDPRVHVISSRQNIGGNEVIKVMVLAEPDKGIIASPGVPQSIGTANFSLSELSYTKVLVSWNPDFLLQPIHRLNNGRALIITDFKVFDTSGQLLLDGAGNPLVSPTRLFKRNLQ